MKRVYTFGDGKAEGDAGMRNLLGGKGANLAEMNLLGMPVPPGFTITTEVCTEYTQYGKDEVVNRIQKEVEAAVAHVETLTGKKFDDPANPLLVSVRSGARASMPGMMDTVLNTAPLKSFTRFLRSSTSSSVSSFTPLSSLTLSMISSKGSMSFLLLGFMPRTTSPYICTKRR